MAFCRLEASKSAFNIFPLMPSSSPYFKKAENFNEPSEDHQTTNSSLYEKSFHGTGGPMHNTYSATYGASHQHWHKTLNSLGIKTNASHFSGSNVGCWTTITTVTPDKQERCYSATAYYRPAASRPNLSLLTEAVAQEILMEKEGTDWVVKGVRFTYGGKDHVVKVSGEVVICGGSVSSPQLLELSGIGRQISETFLLLLSIFWEFCIVCMKNDSAIPPERLNVQGFHIVSSIADTAMYPIFSSFWARRIPSDVTDSAFNIGQPEVLKAANIDCKVDSPCVGENFQEHMSEFCKPSPVAEREIDKSRSDRNDI